MDFKQLTGITQLDEIDNRSNSKKQILYKHSTRCHVCLFVKKKLTAEFSSEMEKHFDIYYLDLLNHREVSKAIEERYAVKHESPQILVISNGVCVHHASHDAVSLENIL